jgi:hypothetical protein
MVVLRKSISGYTRNRMQNPTIKKRDPQQHRLGSILSVRGFKARLLASSRFASGKSCDWPTRSRFSMVFLGPKANAELVPKFDVALHASHAALPMVALEISPCTNVTLTWAGSPCSWGIWVREPYTEKTK